MSQLLSAMRWAPYTWLALPVATLIALSRYPTPLGLDGWMPFLVLGMALLAVERGCLQLFSLTAGARTGTRRDLGYQLVLALGFLLVLWSFREFMNQSLG